MDIYQFSNCNITFCSRYAKFPCFYRLFFLYLLWFIILQIQCQLLWFFIYNNIIFSLLIDFDIFTGCIFTIRILFQYTQMKWAL